MEHDPVEGVVRQRSLLSRVWLPLTAFLLGLAAAAWLLANWSAAGRYIGVEPAAPAPLPVVDIPPPVVTIPAPANPADGQTVVIDPEITRRVGQLEQRVVAIDEQSRSAVGNADRAEGLLVAFAARRALDRGVALGYLEGLLRQRFGTSQRQAVATIITAAQQPVTLEELQQGLQEVGPQLTGAAPDQSWWDALRTEMADLITVRKAGTPPTIPAERLQRAKRRLDAGQVDVALAEVLRMPGRGHATAWIGDARRYVSARRALDTIETAALLEPRAPRVENPDTPADATTPRPEAAPAP